jgi:hypothetical protein
MEHGGHAWNLAHGLYGTQEKFSEPGCRHTVIARAGKLEARNISIHEGISSGNQPGSLTAKAAAETKSTTEKDTFAFTVQDATGIGSPVTPCSAFLLHCVKQHASLQLQILLVSLSASLSI